jgi:hypothetical protein
VFLPIGTAIDLSVQSGDPDAGCFATKATGCTLNRTTQECTTTLNGNLTVSFTPFC